MNNLQAEVMETANALKKSIGGAKFDSAKAIKNVVDVTSKANKLKKESIQIDKLKKDAMIQESKALQELEKIEQQKLKTQSQQMRNDKQQTQEKERLLKTNQKAVKVAKDEASAYKKLEKNTRALKNQSKELGAQMLVLEQNGKRNTTAYQKLSKQYRNVTSSAKAGDKQLKKLDQTVGDNFRNVGNYTGALNKLRGGLGALGLAFGTAQIVRNIGGIIVDFDQAQADLGAISGKTKDQLSGLTAQAKELGSTTQFTATEITQMQIELAKLGFTTSEITASTKAVSNFAAATGADLASASKVAGSTLRAFGLEASQMERVVSTLGVATTKSALSFSSFETSMSTIAPVAATAGFSVEDTTALLATLADAGFDASSAATATRNILLNLANANGDLAQTIGKPIKGVEDLAEAFGELENKGIDLGEALELTDKRSVGAFLQIVKGSDDLVNFRDSITDVNGELQAMADKRLDSIQGQMTLFGSAWEGLILKLGEAGGVMNVLKQTIGFLGRNLSTIASILGTLIKVWVSYKLAIIALNTVQKIQMLGMKNVIAEIMKAIPFTKAYRNEQIKLNTATKGGATATNGYAGTMSALMLTGIIVFLSNVALAWFDVATGARDATERTKAYNKAKELGSKKAEVFVSKEREALEKSIRDLRKQGLTQEEFDKRRTELQEDAIKKNADEVKSIEAKRKKLLRYTQDLEFVNRLADKGAIRDATVLLKTEAQGKKAEAKINQSIKNFKLQTVQAETSKLATEGSFKRFARIGRAGVLELQTNIDALKEAGKELTVQMDELEIAEIDKDKLTPKLTDKTKTYNTEFKKTNGFISEQIKLLQDLQKIEQDRELINQQKGIDAEFNAQIKNIEETGKFDADQLNKLIQEKVETETRYIEQRTEVAKQFLLDQYDFEKNARLQALKDERDALIEKAKENKDALKTIEENYQIELKDLQDEEIQREIDNDLKIENLEQTKTNNILKIQEDGYKSQEELLSEFTDKVIEYNDQQMEKTKEIYKSISELVKTSTDYFIKQSQKKIDQINKEINKAQEQYDYFKQLALNGNIDAKDSLAEQQKIINEANKKKLQEEKRQQRIRMAESVFNTYSSKVESGSKNPLSETIRDTSLLLQFINSIPAFYDGTEDTGATGKGVDGRGGFHAVLHPNERVLPKSLNQQIGDLSNEELTRLAVDYKNGRVIEGASQTSSAMDLAILVNELSDIKRTIENKPETNIELGQITQSMMEVVKSTKKGNTIVYNRYKIKK